MRVAHAVLHAFDFETGASYLSEQELDLENRQVRSYVQRSVRRCLSSSDNRTGSFAEDSNFKDELGLYRSGQLGFVDLTSEIAQWFWEELRRGEDLQNADLLVAEVEDTPKATEPQEGEDVGSLVADALDAKPERTFCILLLPRRQSFVHELAGFEGHTINGVVRTDATLPSPTQKIDTYALVDLDSLAIRFHDKPRPIAGQDTLIVPDGLLQCTTQASTHEAVQAVTRVVEEVSDEFGLNAAEAVSRAKAVVARDVEQAEGFEPGEVGREVFEDAPEMQRRYEERYQEAARTENLPEEVPMRPSEARRMAQRHRIRTDTGIDISFPSEYGHDSTYLAFSTDADGHITIVIRNVAKIENR